MVEKIVAANLAVDKLNDLQAKTAQSSAETSTSSSPPKTGGSPVADVEGPLVKAIKEGKIINRWLDETAAQLTFHGIAKLHEEIKEGQLCVFFRNNHFSTIVMHEAALWMLVTDQGYTRQQGIVWEKLDSTDGDSVFATSSFDEWRGEGTDFAALPDLESLKIQQDPALYGYTQSANDLDEQLARQLQEKEDRKAAKAAMSQSQNPNSQPRQPNTAARPLNQSASAGRAGAKRPHGNGPPARPGAVHQGKEESDDCVIL